MTPVVTVRWQRAAGLAWAGLAPWLALAGPPPIADPAAAVPPARYRSVFADTPTGVEPGATDWVKANADVGEFRNGFVDILRWEQSQKAQPSAPAVPAALPTPAAAPPAHRHAH